ncbi:hypothetical protein HanIR_Chr15g0753751 [Helianthus annuus]|nr:hypothetical protein HanIR_Chr15g0753751 [Helianthus annuus]
MGSGVVTPSLVRLLLPTHRLLSVRIMGIIHCALVASIITQWRQTVISMSTAISLGTTQQTAAQVFVSKLLKLSQHRQLNIPLLRSTQHFKHPLFTHVLVTHVVTQTTSPMFARNVL